MYSIYVYVDVDVDIYILCISLGLYICCNMFETSWGHELGFSHSWNGKSVLK